MFNSFVRNVLTQFSTSKSNASRPRVCFVSKRFKNKDLRRRALRLEQLEDRALLSVSTGEYAEIRDAYPALELPETAANLNVIEIEATNLTIEGLKAAIEEAGTTKEDDLIVVRTTDDLNTIVYSDESDEIVINIDSSKCGKLNIVALGTQSLTLDAAQKTRVLNINDGLIGLANLTITGGRRGEQTVGGGVFVYEGGLTLTNSTIFGNSTLCDGGGVFVYMGSLRLTNSTVSGNSANYGGGVCVDYSNSLTMTNSTISGNSANYYGGVYVASGTFTTCNTILSQNYGGNLYGALSSSSTNNLIDVSPLFVCAPEFDESGVLTNAESLDFHLRSKSPAINAGNNQSAYKAGLTVDSTDLAGESRFVGGSIDIGAYEYRPTVDLTFYQPSDWSDSVIVSSSPDATTSRFTFFERENVFIRFAFNATKMIDEPFYQNVYLDDELVDSRQVDGLDQGEVYEIDSVIKGLSVGEHTIKVKLDATNEIDETNESNNERTVTITATPLTALTSITTSTTQPRIGTEVSTTLYADSETISEDSATYQWYRVSNSPMGKARAISGATSSSYTPCVADFGYYLRVVATAKESFGYSGSVSTTTSDKILGDDDYEVNDTRAKAYDLGTLTAPMELDNLVAGANQNQDWFKFTLADTNYAVKLTYEHVSGSDDVNLYLYDESGVQLAKSKGLTGVESILLNDLTPGTYYVMAYNYQKVSNGVDYELSFVSNKALTSITTSTTQPRVGSEVSTTLYAGTETVSDDSVTYQWYRVSESPDGKAKAIAGATSSSYTPVIADFGYYLRVVATAKEDSGYSGVVSMTISNKILGDDDYEINDKRVQAYDLGTLTAPKTLYDLVAGANQNQDWFKVTLPLMGTSDSYVELTYDHVSKRDDVNLYLYDASGNQLVKSKGLTGVERISLEGCVAGTYYVMAYNYQKVSNAVDYELSFVTDKLLTSVSTSTTQPRVGSEVSTTLYAGTETVSDDSVTYQWYRVSENPDGKAKAIAGATSSSYTPVVADFGYYLRVVATAKEDSDYMGVVSMTIENTVLGDDDYEINDKRAKAYDLGTLTTPQTLTNLVAGANQNQDWFKFTLADDGTSDSYVELTYDHVSQRDDVNLYLYDASGVQLVKSKGLTGVERISLEGRKAGTYYVMAYNYRRVSNAVDYKLSFVPNKVENSQLASIPAYNANDSAFRSVFEDSSFTPFEEEDEFDFVKAF